jgi:hypothetical protein
MMDPSLENFPFSPVMLLLLAGLCFVEKTVVEIAKLSTTVLSNKAQSLTRWSLTFLWVGMPCQQKGHH